MKFSKVAILGGGLLGGSIAKALHSRKDLCAETIVWARREETVTEVQSAGIAATTELRRAVEDAEIVILAMTIGAMAETLGRAKPFLSPFAVVTDVGSVKASVCRQCSDILGETARFIGSHPMAGSEQSGFAHSRPDLLDNAVCIITPEPRSEAAAVETICSFWKALGMRTLELSPEDHDRIVGLVSHLPHLTAAALVDTATADGPDHLKYSGGGFRDSTRVAEGPAPMWAEILLQNQSALLEALATLQDRLATLEKMIQTGDRQALEQFLENARRTRSRMSPAKGLE
ncbi:prephenate dehydrogenase [Oscillatoria laete-virens NRMC-F 0139]|nr:prephenate dehydrogenase [Oscillatoria laete-virens]MDL5053633.1 prephenate dehydrogenase [Oscillatoria laete-virens NRMC-F 0139]